MDTASSLNSAIESAAIRAIQFHEEVARYHADEAAKLRQQLKTLREKRGVREQ